MTTQASIDRDLIQPRLRSLLSSVCREHTQWRKRQGPCPWPAWLYASPQSGATTAAKALCEFLAGDHGDKGNRSAYMVDWPDLVGRYDRGLANPLSDDFQALRQRLEFASVVVVDGVGGPVGLREDYERQTDWDGHLDRVRKSRHAMAASMPQKPPGSYEVVSDCLKFVHARRTIGLPPGWCAPILTVFRSAPGSLIDSKYADPATLELVCRGRAIEGEWLPSWNQWFKSLDSQTA